VPLNDGYNWKGDPNATVAGQSIPHLPSPPGAIYDTATGTYIGPDGRPQTETAPAAAAPAEKTWQSMVLPPTS
jgi:phospholipid/cholesterol/gamma-HCH transport system substrate-binding protein